MNLAKPLVSVVDDDESIRESLPALLQVLGFRVQTFSSGAEFLGSSRLVATDALILDVAMPDMSGLDLQKALHRLGHRIPVIYITAQFDRRIKARVLSQGAIECLFKPFSDTDLERAIWTAIRST